MLPGVDDDGAFSESFLSKPSLIFQISSIRLWITLSVSINFFCMASLSSVRRETVLFKLKLGGTQVPDLGR